MRRTSTADKTSIRLSIGSELIEEAKALGINLPQEAEKGITLDAVFHGF